MLIHSHHFSTVLLANDAILKATATELVEMIKRAVDQAGLRAVTEATATFYPQGLSAVLVLEESHVALHVWPECRKIAVDIHVCDYQQDNRLKAERLAEVLALTMADGCTRTQWNYLFTAG